MDPHHLHRGVTDYIDELETRIHRLEGALFIALPYVEDAQESPLFKAGRVKADIRMIREVLEGDVG